jgi:hypothetical protein
MQFDTFSIDDVTADPATGRTRTEHERLKSMVAAAVKAEEVIDMAGLPLKTVLEQLDLLGEEVLPVLRKELAALRPA